MTCVGLGLSYAAADVPAQANRATLTTIAVTLNPAPPVLAPVRTTEAWTSPWLREFEERRRTRSRYFVTEADIRAAHGSDIGVLLEAKVPGIRLGGQHVYSLRGPNGFGPSGRCQVAVYLDGQRSPTGNVAEWPLSLLGGIEYYSPSTAPVRYRESGRSEGGSAACGVLLLWTRP